MPQNEKRLGRSGVTTQEQLIGVSPTRSYKNTWAISLLCLVQFIDVLGVTSATTAIPAMLRGVGAPQSAAGMVVTAYAMFFGALLVLGARLGDKLGHRKVLIAGVVLFATVAVVGALSTDVWQLVAARSIQGIAAAISVPSALSLILHAAGTGPRRSTAIAAWSATGAAAGAAGFIVGGVLTQVFGWRAVFWINAPIGVLLLVGLVTVVPALPPQNKAQKLDVLGALLLTVAVMAIVGGGSFIETPEARVHGIIAVLVGVGIGAGFFVHQRAADQPLIPPDAFRTASLRAGTVVSFANTATTSSATVLATLFLQNELGVTPIEAGLSLLSFSLAVILGSVASKPTLRAIAANRAAGVGLGFIGIGNLVLATTQGNWAGIIAGASLAGLGLGLSSVAGTALGTDVSASLTGSASGILNTGAQLGTALGVAILVLVASPNNYGFLSAFAVAWTLAAFAALGTATWIMTWRPPIRS
ncbi:MFS transporter [Arthrobacter sp. E44]|uniref:MFS transporter n=1 Tax=Arthrobacter sp. E44 TaxID=3341794 RepID=UPI0035A6EF09